MKKINILTDNLPALLENVENSISILKLITRNTASEAIAGEADVANNISLLRGVLGQMKLVHEKLSDMHFWAMKQKRSSFTPRYFTFEDGVIRELSLQEAKAMGKYDERDETGWPADDDTFTVEEAL